MNDSKVSRSYALALLDIGKENNIEVKAELDLFWELVRSNNDLESLLFMDVFTIDERLSVLTSIFEKLKLNELMQNFLMFLVENKRIGLLPSIFTFVTIEKDLSDGFITGVVEGNESEPDSNVIEKLKAHLEKELKQIANLKYKQNKNITAGYKITCGDLQLDATLENQFDRLRKNILAN